MRLAYLAPAALGLLLVGCGPDESEEVEAPPAAPQTEMPATPPAGGSMGDTAPGVETGPASGDIGIDEPVSPGNSPGTTNMESPSTTTPPASNNQ
ncbi:hypothetical protein HKW98_04765 [Stutzerimonas urumqiensis]|uniref:hypothetical protein n=1 Tax=Stutzerimonas urumqiensis TaxID=638269 RepID=UPI003BA8E722